MERISMKLGEQELILETGKMAKQTNGSVFATFGGSAVLATVCCGTKIEERDFVPLQVEYNEKYYAAGKIPGGFLKREGRPKDKEILVSRLIDRPMRPLFSKMFKREIQVVPTTVSADQSNPPDVVAMVAASAAVHISDVPFDGPIGAVRVSRVDGAYRINPTFEEIERGELDIVVAGSEHGIMMVEGGAQQVSEEVMLGAIEAAREPIAELCRMQDELRAKVGKEKLSLVEAPEELPIADKVREYLRPKVAEATFTEGKFGRSSALKAVAEEALEQFRDEIEEEDEPKLKKIFEDVEREVMRGAIVEQNKRCDGRGPEDIRDITCEVDVLNRTHGSALFTRGETQALAITTLGTVYDEQIMDDLEGDRREHFMLHYNFPPFSVGETGRLGTGRREIGHGHLAHRALENLIPNKEAFPYTIRVVSEVLESNGSSSMATVCGGSLSLMNAGVPIEQSVAGIAMGLVQEGDTTVVLSDILGEEDHLGDMDFKVAGTKDGITAFQMDIKISNVSQEIMNTALDQARRGRMHILEKMNAVIEKPREVLSEHAPRILSFKVDPEKIGLLIGPGGKTIKAIQDRHEVKVSIEDSGLVTVYSKDKAGAEEAREAFLALLEEPEVGKTYDGVVRRIVDFGAFIEFLPGKEGLCHISKMAPGRVNQVSDVLQMNQEVPVKIIEIDKMGRVNLSLIYEADDESGRGGDGDRDRPREGRGRDDRERSGRGGDRGGRGGDRGGRNRRD